MNSFDENMTPRDRVDGIDSILRELMGSELEQNPLPTPPPCQTRNNHTREHVAEDNGDCEFRSLAMVISPYQDFDELYTSCEEALRHGTLFRTLFMPMEGKGPCARQTGGLCK